MNNLKQDLMYEPSTGHWVRLTSKRTDRIGTRCDTTQHPSGYLCVWYKGKLHLAHRLAYFYMNGEWPQFEVDHVNGERADNRWVNLRAATRAEQMQNLAPMKHNTSGYPGVGQDPNGRWRAYITVDGKRKHLGYHDTAEQAYAAYVTAKAQHHSFQPFVRSQA